MNTTIVIAVMSALIITVGFVVSYLEGRRDWKAFVTCAKEMNAWRKLQRSRIEALESHVSGTRNLIDISLERIGALEKLVMELHGEEMKKKSQGRTMHG